MTTKPIAEFASVADRYCTAIETCSGQCDFDLASRFRRLIPDLYLATLGLPDIDLADSDPEVATMTHDDWAKTFSMIASGFGRFDLYWTVLNSDDAVGGDSVAGSVADDLSDIWRDLRCGLITWRLGTDAHQRSATWHWRFTFTTHWSRHAVDALGALDRIVANCSGSSDADG